VDKKAPLWCITGQYSAAIARQKSWHSLRNIFGDSCLFRADSHFFSQEHAMANIGIFSVPTRAKPARLPK
jgi:hypothetical protein